MYGQFSADKVNNVSVKRIGGGPAYELPWIGGLNAPQFSEIDLNDDGIKDLFVFDREGSKVLTFLNGGTSGQVDYTYAPQYESAFPAMVEFALLVDYNNDGKEDLFTHNGGGAIIAYKNTSSGGNLSFSQVSPFIEAYYNATNKANLYVSRLDIPAIVDVDSDGDMDVLSFSNASTSLNYFENFAADSGNLEDFKFHLNTGCWGNFAEDALSNVVTLNTTCPKVKSKSGDKHAGSTILAFDPDGDGDKDLLLGDISYPTMIYLSNGGNKFIADITSQTNNYPPSKAVNLQVFPAAYLVDVNNDGLKDLLVAPNSKKNIENVKGVLYYKNTGSSSSMQFSYVQNDFLQGEMLEFGTGAYPAFTDVDFDGLMDIVVGNNGLYKGANNPVSRLVLLKNTGTASQPEFTVVDSSYAGIEELDLNTTLEIPTLDVTPAFGDINGDGFEDMMIGDYQGKIHLFINQPQGGESNYVLQEADFLSADVGQYASPALFDIDGDGDKDLLIGDQDGFLEFYRNDGSGSNADFQFVTDELGGVNTRPPLSYFGYNRPIFIRTENDIQLISGSYRGRLFTYNNILGNLSSTFNKADTMYLGIDVGERSHVAAYDIDNDSFLEFIIGNSGGGLSYYETDYSVGIDEASRDVKNDIDFILAEGRDYLQITVTTSGAGPFNLNMFNASGQLIDQRLLNNTVRIPTNSLPEGLYLISLRSGNKMTTKKYMKGP